MITAGLTVPQHWPGANGLHAAEAAGRAQVSQTDQAASTERAGGPAEPTIAFGPFQLLPTRRLLLEADRPVRLGSRALEILIALVERPGELVGKNELMARVWPSTFVEEGNLKVQVAGLRRALGDSRGSNRYLATVPGRGYRFVAPVRRIDEPSFSAPQATAEAAHRLPAPMTDMVDRADSVAALMVQLPRHRFITIVGPGGIGKTTVALAVARGLVDAYQHGVRFVDLASVREARLVPGALADALGLTAPGLIGALRDRRMLLVLDNCEHVIEACAAWTVEALNGAPEVQILATSREPLRAEGEHVHRLAPLASPPPSAGLTAAAALGFPAVQLFVERAAATSGTFSFGDAEAPLVAEICRRLDGLPLAIELAAARVDAFGVRGLAARLDDCLQLLTGGRRAALPRHQTFRAALDWGHELLPEAERVVLRRLAVFSGSFTLEAASAVAADAGITEPEVVECVANLVTKSLVAADVGGALPCYRLLGTIRAYALEKLIASGELEQVERRRAGYAWVPVQPAETERAPHAPTERLTACGRRIDHRGAAWDSGRALALGTGKAAERPARWWQAPSLVGVP
jgi:predicted ATPase/DNA-binding winged helix-turn-helix (wHTH) protein